MSGETVRAAVRVPKLNPHWLAYCRANGRRPAAQLRHDRRAYRGGPMAGFIVWVHEQGRAYRAAHGLRDTEPLPEGWLR